MDFDWQIVSNMEKSASFFAKIREFCKKMHKTGHMS